MLLWNFENWSLFLSWFGLWGSETQRVKIACWMSHYISHFHCNEFQIEDEYCQCLNNNNEMVIWVVDWRNADESKSIKGVG